MTVESVSEPSTTRTIPLGPDLERLITPIALIGGDLGVAAPRGADFGRLPH